MDIMSVNFMWQSHLCVKKSLLFYLKHFNSNYIANILFKTTKLCNKIEIQ